VFRMGVVSTRLRRSADDLLSMPEFLERRKSLEMLFQVLLFRFFFAIISLA
jgi:hypothetical protein